MKIHRKLIFLVLDWLRRSRMRRPILKLLCRLHNSSYHWTSFFASKGGSHPKHRIINYHKFFKDRISSEDSVVDLGSGTGEVAFDLVKKAKCVTGIDNNMKSVIRARKKYKRDNLKFIFGDINNFEPKNKFDIAILSNTLEHIDERVKVLQVISKYSETILIRVPLLTRDWITVFKKEMGFEYRLDNTHYIEYTQREFENEMKAAGLRITELVEQFGEMYAVCKKI